MDAYTALTTTRAVRRRLDTTRPVPRNVITECVEIAAQAPSGGNRQRLRWVMVEDPATRLEVVNAFREPAEALYGKLLERATERGSRLAYQGALDLLARLETVPLLAIPCMTGGPRGPMEHPEAAAFYGSAIPGIWSFQLALRTFGLGSSYTTVHLPREREVADVLGIPEGISQIAMLPVAYTVGSDFKPASRLPVSDTVYYNRWVHVSR